MAAGGSELQRKLVHIAAGLPAFAVPFLGLHLSLLLAAILILGNAFVLPWLLPGLWREGEREGRFKSGIVLYPTAVFVVLLLFHQRVEIGAAVWAILAFGDGAAGLFGRGAQRSLPWNPKKTWAGLAAYVLLGGPAAYVVLVLSGVPWHLAAWAAGVAVVGSALLESQAQKLDDNVLVPPLTGLLCLGCLDSRSWEPEPAVAGVGLLLNVTLAVVGLKVGALDKSGAWAGVILGTLVYACLDWAGFAVMAAFVVLGVGASKLGYRVKAARGLAQEKGGRRGARHAIANAGVASIAACFAASTGNDLYVVAFLGAFASATADTLSSEIGQLLNGKSYLVTDFREVPPGTDGGVSWAGSLAGLGGAAAIGLLAWAVGLTTVPGAIVVVAAGVLGNLADSFLGATLERAGHLDNEGVNFLATLAGALAAVGLS